MQSSEPRNPFYFLLLLASLAFVVTALAYTLLPVLEEKAIEAGETFAPSAFKDAIKANGWRWLLYEVAAMVVLGLASMGLDRWRRLQIERASRTIPPAGSEPPK